MFGLRSTTVTYINRQVGAAVNIHRSPFGEPSGDALTPRHRVGIDWKRLNTPRAIFDSGASRLSGPVTVGRISVLKTSRLAVRVVGHMLM